MYRDETSRTWFFCHLSKHVFKQFDKERHKHKLNTSRYTIDTDKNSVIKLFDLTQNACSIYRRMWHYNIYIPG